MSKMSELSLILDDLIECGRKLIETGMKLKDFYSSTNEEAIPESAKKETEKPVQKEKEKPVEKTYSKEDVRAILAAKAGEADGKYRAEVRNLVRKYGNGGSLTDVDPKDYAALAAEAEGIGHAG